MRSHAVPAIFDFGLCKAKSFQNFDSSTTFRAYCTITAHQAFVLPRSSNRAISVYTPVLFIYECTVQCPTADVNQHYAWVLYFRFSAMGGTYLHIVN
jgi:hypothetical protein